MSGFRKVGNILVTRRTEETVIPSSKGQLLRAEATQLGRPNV